MKNPEFLLLENIKEIDHGAVVDEKFFAIL